MFSLGLGFRGLGFRVHLGFGPVDGRLGGELKAGPGLLGAASRRAHALLVKSKLLLVPRGPCAQIVCTLKVLGSV